MDEKETWREQFWRTRALNLRATHQEEMMQAKKEIRSLKAKVRYRDAKIERLLNRQGEQSSIPPPEEQTSSPNADDGRQAVVSLMGSVLDLCGHCINLALHLMPTPENYPGKTPDGVIFVWEAGENGSGPEPEPTEIPEDYGQTAISDWLAALSGEDEGAGWEDSSAEDLD